jgi:acetolactate decarboxylase
VRELDPATKTPFAVVVPFSAERELEILEPLDLGALYARVEEAVPESGGCVALRLDGYLRWVRLRSVRPQEPPYRPLAEALEEQVVYELHDASGTVVGFRFPQAAQGIEVAGYHLHFITDDRRRGGHVLDLRGASGRLALDRSSELHLEVPPGTGIRAADSGAGKRELLDRLEGGVAERP